MHWWCCATLLWAIDFVLFELKLTVLISESVSFVRIWWRVYFNEFLKITELRFQKVFIWFEVLPNESQGFCHLCERTVLIIPCFVEWLVDDHYEDLIRCNGNVWKWERKKRLLIKGMRDHGITWLWEGKKRLLVRIWGGENASLMNMITTISETRP